MVSPRRLRCTTISAAVSSGMLTHKEPVGESASMQPSSQSNVKRSYSARLMPSRHDSYGTSQLNGGSAKIRSTSPRSGSFANTSRQSPTYTRVLGFRAECAALSRPLVGSCGLAVSPSKWMSACSNSRLARRWACNAPVGRAYPPGRFGSVGEDIGCRV